MHLVGNKRSAVYNEDLGTSIPLAVWQGMRNIRTQYNLPLKAGGIGKIFMFNTPMWHFSAKIVPCGAIANST